jgi:lipooligosaccharide transport system ATP-binding protein
MVDLTAVSLEDDRGVGFGPEPMVQARDLVKIYPARRGGVAFTAVHGIDFEVRRGETFGFLGPNGAGKSSTMRMIGCVSPLSGGSLRILGLDASSRGADIRARLGSVPQDDALDNELTVRENLVVYGRFFGLARNVVRERSDALLEFARLNDKAEARVAELSGGMRRRLTIARSLINLPDLLLLDEPTTGLDPQARHLLWERLFQLKQDGVTLILTTHYMDEAEQLCDRLVIMDGGRIVAEGSPRALIERHVTREVLELRFAPGEQARAVSQVQGIGERVDVLPDRLLCFAHDGDEALAAVHRRGLEPIATLVRRSSLEDVFLTLTGRSLDE